MTMARESGLEREHRQVFRKWQFHKCTCKPQLCEVLMERHSFDLSKDIREVSGGRTYGASYIRKSDAMR